MNRKTLEIQRPYRQIDDGCSFMIAQRVLRLPDEDSGLSHSIVRFENSRVGFGCLKLKRRTAIRITNKKNGQWIIRYCMGNGGKIKGLNKEFIAIDYDGVNELGVTFNKDVRLSVDRADWWDITRWFWTFPDLNVKLSFRLGLIGFLLGTISLADLIAKLFIA
ncbi:hypothetical protein L8R84_05820 [Vibrio splendidus]|uniref:hypothetical protein n=1 Tax=Vibrio splendidus TaxID=29497 RepID=UPI0024693640|nr:hypothetical protein [Vibrio splendidus]MDH5935658.1 hypothetical protein [Vibrio splendidus]